MATEPQPAARYTVRPTVAGHRLTCELRLSGPLATGNVELVCPTWVPGDYSFMTLARDLFDVEARDAKTGDRLTVRRHGWQGWTVQGATGELVVEWNAWGYAPELGEPSGLLDSAFCVLLGARYLRAPADLGPCEVHYEVPPLWKGTLRHPSGAERIGETAWRYPSFEILLDTPVVMGAIDTRTRDVSGTPFHFVFVDRGVGFDACADAFVDDVAAAARSLGEVFGGFPFEDYTFVLSLNPQNDWGLEHLTSTMCGLGPDVFTDPDAWAIGVRVCAHELFHAWNVRRLRPAPLGCLAEHLQRGSFTEGLWLAEGFTRYYEFLACARTGVYSTAQFVSNVVGYFAHLTWRPAYARMSAVDASLATYLDHSPKYPGRVNNCIDYYDKGMLIAFSLDADLRVDGAGSLDEAMGALYDRYAGFGPGQPGYTTAQAIETLTEKLPRRRRWLEAAVREPGYLDIGAVLERLGFVVERGVRHMLGLTFDESGPPTLFDVLDDSPAGRAGLAPGDVITAIDGFAFTPAALKWVAGRAAATTIEVTRGHRRLCFTLTPAPRDAITGVRWTGDEAAAKRLADWLGDAAPLIPGQAVPLDFYENFHGVETLL